MLKMKIMKKSFCILLLLFFLVGQGQLSAQSKSITDSKLDYTSKRAITYKPFTYSDFVPKGTKVDGNKTITLPNRKKVPLKKYVDTMNKIEKGLSKKGYSTRTLKSKNKIAKHKKGSAVKKGFRSTRKLTAVPKSTISKYFNANSNSIPIKKLGNKKSYEMSALKIAKSKFNPGKIVAPGQLINLNQPVTSNRNHQLEDQKFELFGFGASVKGGYSLTGSARRGDDNSTYSMGFNMRAAMKLPTDLSANIPIVGEVGLPDYIDFYRFEAKYEVNKNSSRKLHKKTLVKVLDRILINESGASATGAESMRVRHTRTFPITKKMGQSSFLLPGIGLMLPAEFHNSITVGGTVDVRLSPSGIRGQIGPTIGSSILLEAGVLPADFNDIVNVGVGGRLDIIEVSPTFAGNVGLTFTNNAYVYNDVAAVNYNIELIKGRLYWFYDYPSFICDNIFTEGFKISCWGIRRVETDLVDTGALFSFNGAILDDDDTRQL